MCGTHARQQSHTPRIFTSITRRNSSTGISWNGRSSSELNTAALFTRMSSRPNAFIVRSQVGNVGLVRHVGSQAKRPAARGLGDLGGRLVVFFQVGDHDRGAVPGEAQRERLADAGRPA